MDLDRLREETLKLVEDYNSKPIHRKLEPIKGYGFPDSIVMDYWIHWHDDIDSTRMIGFTYIVKEKKLSPVGDLDANIPSLEEALKNFEEQLKEIPLKNVGLGLDN